MRAQRRPLYDNGAKAKDVADICLLKIILARLLPNFVVLFVFSLPPLVYICALAEELCKCFLSRCFSLISQPYTGSDVFAYLENSIELYPRRRINHRHSLHWYCERMCRLNFWTGVQEHYEFNLNANRLATPGHHVWIHCWNDKLIAMRRQRLFDVVWRTMFESLIITILGFLYAGVYRVSSKCYHPMCRKWDFGPMVFGLLAATYEMWRARRYTWKDWCFVVLRFAYHRATFAAAPEHVLPLFWFHLIWNVSLPRWRLMMRPPEDLSKIKCYCCGQLGHQQADCTVPNALADQQPKIKKNPVNPSANATVAATVAVAAAELPMTPRSIRAAALERQQQLQDIMDATPRNSTNVRQNRPLPDNNTVPGEIVVQTANPLVVAAVRDANLDNLAKIDAETEAEKVVAEEPSTREIVAAKQSDLINSMIINRNASALNKLQGLYGAMTETDAQAPEVLSLSRRNGQKVGDYIMQISDFVAYNSNPSLSNVEMKRLYFCRVTYTVGENEWWGMWKRDVSYVVNASLFSEIFRPQQMATGYYRSIASRSAHLVPSVADPTTESTAAFCELLNQYQENEWWAGSSYTDTPARRLLRLLLILIPLWLCLFLVLFITHSELASPSVRTLHCLYKDIPLCGPLVYATTFSLHNRSQSEWEADVCEVDPSVVNLSIVIVRSLLVDYLCEAMWFSLYTQERTIVLTIFGILSLLPAVLISFAIIWIRYRSHPANETIWRKRKARALDLISARGEDVPLMTKGTSAANRLFLL